MSWTRFLRRKHWDEERARELEAYLEAETDDNIARGMSSEEARYSAHRKLGNTTLIREEIYHMNSLGWLETLWQDLRFALRMLRKNLGFTAVAVVSLALGISANSAIFSIVDTQLLRPCPVRDPARLAVITTDFGNISYPDYLDIRQQADAFSDVVAYGDRGGFIGGGPQRAGLEFTVEVVSQNYFEALGVKALRGRTFSPQPDQAAAEGHFVVVSDHLWQHYFDGDPSLPGKIVLLDGREFTVIGIAPPDFCGLRHEGAPDMWLTKEGWETMVPGEDSGDAARDNRWFEVAGHLRSKTQISEARAQLQTLAQRLAIAFPASNHNVKFLAHPASEWMYHGMQTGIYMMAMVGLVLLICCANVANLLLAQTERRQREIAMRRALGAGRRRLVGQLFTEGLLLSVAGGAVGVVLAAWLLRLGPALVPGLADMNLKLDGRVLLFTSAISLLSALIFGLAPAFHAVKGDLSAALKGEKGEHATGRLPLQSLFVCGEIALSVVLLAGSALLLRSLLYSQSINPGFDPKGNVVMLSVAPPMLYGYKQAQAAALYPALAARVESVPGVVRASYARRAPMTEAEGGETQAVVIPGVQPPPGTDHFEIRYNIVAPKFFATVGARIEKGREFNQFDLPSTAPVVIVNDVMAQRFWPGQNPLGRSLQIGKKDYQIVGVVEAGRYVRLHETIQPYLYLPFTQVFSFECVLFVQTAGDPRSFLPAILKETAAVDKNLPIVDAVTFKDYMQEVLSEERSRTELLASLGILGIFLAAVGLYATVAYHVSRRSHEIGIRMALGARRNDVLNLVLQQGLRFGGIGAVMGLIGALAASRLMSEVIYGVPLLDPLSYSAAILAAVSVALLASYLPARRATKVDPMVALRHE